MTSEILATIVGGLIVLAGAVVANIFNNFRQKKQFSHEIEMEKRLRDMNLKKEVYFPAIESFNFLIYDLLTYPANIGKENNEANELFRNNVSLSKVELVGSDETIQLIGEVSEEIIKGIFPIIMKRAQFDSIHSELNSVNSEYEIWEKKHERFYDESLELVEKRIENKLEETRLNENIESVEKILEEMDEKIESLKDREYNVYKELSIICLNAAMKISELTGKAISLMRNELNLPFDKIRYEKMVSKQIELAKKTYSDVFKGFDDIKD